LSDYPAWTNPMNWRVQERELVKRNLGERALAKRTHCSRRGHVDPLPVVAGTELCIRCHNRLRLNIEALADAWPALVSSIMKRPQASLSDKVSTSGHGDVGGLWNPAAAAAIAELTDWTGFLVRTIVRDQPVPEPEETREAFIAATSVPVWDEKGRRYDKPLTLPARRREYHRVVEVATYTHGIATATHPRTQLQTIAKWHARWLSSYPGLGPALVDDVLHFREMVTNAINAVGVRRIEVRDQYCQQLLEETEVGPMLCNGPLVGVIRPQDDNRPSEIICSTNPSHRRIPVEEWILAR
jgi:hypothetical protein